MCIEIARTDSVTVGLQYCAVYSIHRYLIDAASIENWIKQSQTAFTLINIKFFSFALTRTFTLYNAEYIYALALPIGVFKP